ncbi:MAG: cellulase family glycosylhydrolase, partial [Chloroflexi bacterium]|nr:cellulase family glycosylhydrolase [Chloroflexota bacterium]
QGNKARFLATWRQLAQHCRRWGYPDRVLLELLNEPCRELTPALWQGYLQEVYSLVREIQPERTLIIGPAEFNSIDALPKLELPQEDGNIIVTVHYYRPGEFTHQGAHWSRHRDLSGIEHVGGKGGHPAGF